MQEGEIAHGLARREGDYLERNARVDEGKVGGTAHEEDEVDQRNQT
jgi:hypothetical protein